MYQLLDNIKDQFEQLLLPLCVLILAFILSTIIQYIKERQKSDFCEITFSKKFIVVHFMACIFALIFICIYYFVPKDYSGITGVIALVVFYSFLIKIIMLQNEDNGGYIEDLDGASGAIIYITSALSPLIFIVFHGVLAVICFFVYRYKCDDEEIKINIIKQAVNCFEAIVAMAIFELASPDTFIGNLWFSVISISIFTLILPHLNEPICDYIEERI